MLKKLSIILSLLFLLIFIIQFIGKFWTLNQTNKSLSQMQVKITPSIVKDNLSTKNRTSIFVPYWSDWSGDIGFGDYDRLIYFGVTVSGNGIERQEAGYEKIGYFIEQAEKYNKEKWLTLRMTNTDDNLSILGNIEAQKKIIEETINLVKTYRFNGLVLDLELSIMPLEKTTNQINNFVQKFYTTFFNENIKLTLALYGDNFYRRRPYDLAFLTKSSDEIMIMAYDLHKARGEPGPNFPLSGQSKYGYDLKSMFDDFGQYVPKNKLTIIFGMYGYDWIVDEKKRPIKTASSLSLNQINQKIVPSCKSENCVLKRDDISKETEINYVDRYNNLHIVWYEDEKSVEEKIKYLKEKGIFNFTYWAYGYF